MRITTYESLTMDLEEIQGALETRDDELAESNTAEAEHVMRAARAVGKAIAHVADAESVQKERQRQKRKADNVERHGETHPKEVDKPEVEHDTRPAQKEVR